MASDMFMCFFFKQKTAYELRISDWSSDVCSSDLRSAANHIRLSPPAAARLCRDRQRLRHSPRVQVHGRCKCALTHRLQQAEFLPSTPSSSPKTAKSRRLSL